MQIFHRCLQGRSEVFSFICPEHTLFHQRNLVCVWDNQYSDFDCISSERYYEESNRAFFGNITAEENMKKNIKNSQEIKNVETSMSQTNSPIKEDIKLYEIIPNEELSIASEDESEMIEKNSIEDKVESASEDVEESNDYQAELIPSSTNHIDASIVTSSDSVSASHNPQKILISVLDPIIEMPNNTNDDDDQTQESVTARNIRKRSGSRHRNRFLFKADTK